MQPTFLLIRMCGMSSHEICCNVQMLSIYSYEHIHILSVCEDSQFQHATNILAWGITESCRWAMSHMQMRYVCCSVLRCVAVCCNTQSHFSMQPTFWREVSQSQVAHFNELCRTYKWDMCVAVCCSVLQCVAVCRSVLQYTESCRTYQWTMSHIRMRYVCCSVLQCVAVCCSVLQCVAGCCTIAHTSCTISYSYDRNKYVYVNLSDNYVYIYLSFLLWDWLSRISEPCHTNECGVLRKHAT